MTKEISDPIVYAREVVGCDPMATFLGISVEEVRERYARCSVTIQPHYLNAVERAHGAILYALGDQVFAVASNSTGNMALAVSFTINYVSSAIDGERVFAEAVPVNVGRKVSVWRVDIRGNEDKLIATGEGVAYHK